MTHCSDCGTPASYITQAQSIPSYASPFAAIVPKTPLLVDNTYYEQPGYAQASQDARNGPQQYSQVASRSSQVLYYAYPPTQQGVGYPEHTLQVFYPSQNQHFMSLQAPKKRRWDGLFLLVIVVCILLLLGMGVNKLIKVVNTSHISQQANTPSGNAIVASASIFLTNAQTSSDIDSNLAPVQKTKTFMANQKIYMTFIINSGKQDGYIEAKWYENGQNVASTVISHMHGNTHGIFSNVYITATPDGAVELYWCAQASCSDAQLAQVLYFVVTPVNTARLHSVFRSTAQHFSKLDAFLII